MAKKMMLVDDSATMRKIIMRTIRAAGLSVDEFVEAGDGNEALTKLGSEGPIDLILCDVNMPGMGGLDFVKNVRADAQYNDTKIVMVSTESSDDLISGVKADGANGYVTKPFTPDSIQKELAPFM